MALTLLLVLAGLLGNSCSDVGDNNTATQTQTEQESPSSPSQQFRITPERPVSELYSEALRAAPPAETGEFKPAELVELVTLDETIRLDIRYAGSDNFMGSRFYQSARAFLQRPAAEAVVQAHHQLKESGYGLLIYDAYRPWFVTWMFWEATPSHLRDFVADPNDGSRHNRGSAVDLTLYDLASGEPVPMPSGYDEFTERAHPDYRDGTVEELRNRDLLRRVMEHNGFQVYPNEWWHFDYHDWRSYPILNVRFEEISTTAE